MCLGVAGNEREGTVCHRLPGIDFGSEYQISEPYISDAKKSPTENKYIK